MIVAIHQPNFLPWLGYFDKMMRSDVFVLLDDVQYPKGSVANRNKIKNNVGQEVWITVPIKLKDGLTYNQLPIDESQKWNTKILNILRPAYSKTSHFGEVYPFIEKLLMEKYENLAALNIVGIKAVCQKLHINTPLYISSELGQGFGEKNDRNLNLCKHFNATIYLSGQGAKKYNQENVFRENHIKIEYQEFIHPVYEQVNGPFLSNLSVIDALFNLGFEETGILLKTEAHSHVGIPAKKD